MDSSAYQVFRRAATSFEEFGTARCWHICYADSAEAAREICREFNDNRNAAQKRKGVKYEYMEGKI